MNPDTDKLIEEQLKLLPEKTRKALETVPWKSSIREIAITNKMSLEQVEIVERETMFVLYGFENADDYIANLIREAQIDETTATTIAQEVDDKIFKTIEAQVEATPAAPAVPEPLKAENLPQVLSSNLPMIEEGEVAHEVPHIETPAPIVPPTTSAPKPEAPAPKQHYEGGKDPYREPLV